MSDRDRLAVVACHEYGAPMFLWLILVGTFALFPCQPPLAGSDPRPSPLADIGPAPRTVLIDAAGKPFDLASLKGKVVLVCFVYTT